MVSINRFLFFFSKFQLSIQVDQYGAHFFLLNFPYPRLQLRQFSPMIFLTSFLDPLQDPCFELEKRFIIYDKTDYSLINLRIRQTQALTFRSGPTESGGRPTTPPPPVGGEMIPIDKISVFLSSSWILILLILIAPIVFIFYRKRDSTLKILSPLVSRLFEFTQRLQIRLV